MALKDIKLDDGSIIAEMGNEVVAIYYQVLDLEELQTLIEGLQDFKRQLQSTKRSKP